MTEVPESSPNLGSKQYQEPDPGSIKRPKDVLDKERMLAEGWRISAIDDLGEFFEPPQEDVLRYPPVQIQLSRRPDFIKHYVSMGSTDWSQICKKIVNENPPESF